MLLDSLRNNLATGFLQGFKSVLERCRISLAFWVRVFADVQTGWDAYKEEMIKKAACREQSGIAKGWEPLGVGRAHRGDVAGHNSILS